MSAAPATDVAARPPLWDGQAILEVTGGSLQDAPEQWQARGVSIDSRDLQPQDLFIALKGENHDGHDFLDAAFANGAAAALVDWQWEAPAALKNGERGGGVRPCRYVRVAQPLQALRALAAHARARSTARIVAVTGSVGKTGIKDALGHVLAKGLSVKVHVSARSCNNHWGVPLSLARLPVDARYGVFEVGMNHAGEITPLARLIAPDVALVSAVRPAHMEFFSSLEQVADAKAEIFTALREGGTAVLGRDDAWFERLQSAALRSGARLVTFGESPQADIRLLQAHQDSEGSHIEAEADGERLAYFLAIAGRHWVDNSLAVLACCHALGIKIGDIAPCFASLQASPGRGNRRRIPWGRGEILLIDESYNANPASMQAAIATLGACRPASGAGAGGGDESGEAGSAPRKIIALGDMLELGDEARNWHVALAADIAAAGIHLTFTCGDLMRHLFDALPPPARGAHFADATALADCLQNTLQAGDALMVKGSNSMGMKAVVQHLESCATEARS